MARRDLVFLTLLLGSTAPAGGRSRRTGRTTSSCSSPTACAAMVNDQTAPAMAALAREGVWLRNSHSLFPTFTTANASAMATGHYLGDTGDFSNTIYAGFPVPRRRRQRDAVPRERPGAGRRRRAFRAATTSTRRRS